MARTRRKEALHEVRLRALVRRGAITANDLDQFESSIWRGEVPVDVIPLCFPNNLLRDPGLVNIQLRNQPKPFHPLLDGIPEIPADLASFDSRLSLGWLWSEAAKTIDGALMLLESSRTVFRPRFHWEGWSWDLKAGGVSANSEDVDLASSWLIFEDDYPARYYQAYRKCRCALSSVRKHADSYGDYALAARHILHLDRRLSEWEIYALLALAYAAWALNDLADRRQKRLSFSENAVAMYVDESHRAFMAAKSLRAGSEREAQIKQAWANDSHLSITKRAGSARKSSLGIKALVQCLRAEHGEADQIGARALFDLALRRCREKGFVEVGEFKITATNDDRLTSTHKVTGRADGRTVSFSAWRQRYAN